MLVGHPYSGKSTWTRSFVELFNQSIVIVDTDSYIENRAIADGLTYNQGFDEYIMDASKYIKELVNTCVNERKSLIWDQTNLTIKGRARKLRMVPDHYKMAVVFPVLDSDVLNARIEFRKNKTLPLDVLNSMIKMYQQPTTNESFNEVVLV